MTSCSLCRDAYSVGQGQYTLYYSLKSLPNCPAKITEQGIEEAQHETPHFLFDDRVFVIPTVTKIPIYFERHLCDTPGRF